MQCNLYHDYGGNYGLTESALVELSGFEYCLQTHNLSFTQLIQKNHITLWNFALKWKYYFTSRLL